MPIVTIFGATGTQGSAVVEAVLADGKYTPRAVSRNLDSARSKALVAKGIEVVVGNLWDKDSLKNAIQGSEVVFGVTNFWDPEVFPVDLQGRGEITQGKNLVDAAKEVGVKFFIWSGCLSPKKVSNGLYTRIYHADNKAVIQEYLAASGVPYTALWTGWFSENLWNFGSLQKSETGYIIPIPKFGPDDIQSSTWVAHDLGQATQGRAGQVLPLLTFRFTYPELAEAIATAIKKEVIFTPLETAGTEEFDEMFEFQAKVGVYTDTPLPNPDLVALGVKFGTMQEFLQAEVVPRYA
ncbi:NAD(P)-binding protein [Mycena galopus ATCC 62051]|nr:NAD(P)-binding protein [Mycena galopus ATCC 62051]